jgi:hypothetical protein
MSSEIEFAGIRWNNNICYMHENKMVGFSRFVRIYNGIFFYIIL